MHAASLRPHPSSIRRIQGIVGRELLRSPWVERLARVSFLGTLDRHPHSRARSSRLDHSYGVAELGLQVGESLGLDAKTLRTFVAACLLHDVGHYPLSHAAEPGFHRATGVAHHGVTTWIIRGEGPINRERSLRPVLERAGIDAGEVAAMIDGGEGPPVARLLHASINLDTLDGIVRAARAFGIRGVRLPRELFAIEARRVWIRPRAIPALDRFWALKDRVYCRVINLPSNILCELRLSEAVASRFDRGVFGRFTSFDDRVLSGLLDAQLPGGRLDPEADEAYHFGREAAPGQIRRSRKRYHVDRSTLPGARGLPIERWSRRYRHERQVVYLVPRDPAVQLPLPGLAAELEEPEI